jgi:protocatechuate 3,4-dioxygenase beta subunit
MRTLAHIAAMLGPTAAVTLFLEHAGPRYALGAEESAKPAAVAPSHRAAGPKVAGRILDAWGNPVAFAAVYIAPAEKGAAAERTEATIDGTFHFDRLPGAKVRIVAEDDRSGYVESDELGPDEARNAVLVLEHARAIEGVVTDERGAPVPHATVKAWGEAAVLDRIVVADDEGRYQIPRVGQNATRLSAWARGFEATTVQSTPAASMLVRRDVRLAPAAAIRGVVLDALGHPVQGAQISACQDKEQEGAISGHGGVFTLPATTAGCTASASHPRFATSRVTPIEAGRALTLRLGTGGAIEGIAVDERGRPLGAFSLTIESFEPAEGEPSSSSRAGETHDELRGTFRFDELTPGTYVIGVTSEGHAPAQSSPIEVGRGKVVRGIQIAVGEAEPVVEASMGEGDPAQPAEPASEDPPAEDPPSQVVDGADGDAAE